MTSNIWDKNVEVVTTPSSVKGGETGEFTYGKRALRIGVANPITIGTATCKVSTVVVNGVEYEYTGENYNLVAGTVDGFSKGVSIARELGSIRFAFGGVLSKDVQVKFVYDNVPANPDEKPTFSPVVASSNGNYGTISAENVVFSANVENGSLWTVTAILDEYNLPLNRMVRLTCIPRKSAKGEPYYEIMRPNLNSSTWQQDKK